MAGHASSLLQPDGSVTPAFAPLLHPGEQQTLKELADLASQYRKLKHSCATLGQQSQYMSSLCATLGEILTEYEELVVDTEARVLQRDSELVANATVVPLSAIKATFSIWQVQFTSLCQLVDQLEAGPRLSSSDGRWPPGPLIDVLLQRARTGVERVAAITNRLALGVQHVWRSHLLAYLVHGVLDPADPLASVEDGYRLNAECVPSCVSAQTRESIAYVGRAVAVVGVGVPRRLAVVHARLLGRVLPQDRYAFDEAIERIKTNISEWLWSNVLTRQDVAVAVECFANYFLLRNGEFALALLREIERLKASRLSARPTTRTSGGLIRDTDLSLAILRASLGTTAQNDPSLDSLRFTLVDGPLRPLLPSLQLQAPKPVVTGPVNFDDLLLGARANLSHTLAWPLDLVLGQAELQTYSAIFAYLSALRRGHVKVLECWGMLSSSQRARRRWTGIGEGGAGRKRREEEVEEVEARKRLLRCGWGVVREMVWFFDTLWGYIMTDVIDVQYRKLQTQLRPRRNRRNSSNTRAATTRATSPTSTHFGPTSTNPNLYASTRPSLYTSTRTNVHERDNPNAPDFLDFTTLRTLHATYLGNIVSGSLLGHPGCAVLVRAALETCERFVGIVERWGGDILPGMLEEGSAGSGAGKLVEERFKVVREIDEQFHSHLEAFYEQLSQSSTQTFGAGADASTMINTSMYLQSLFRPRAKGKLGDRAEDRRTVERLSLRLDFNAKFSEPHRSGRGEANILREGGLV
ncbi:gamma-tubulin complex component 5 [Ceratobasidium sp. AG-Ba]|nr:gamma-tubulin complex component 5 [Ceratobasidium sp. AG-Ba]QRW09247.1 gamma-tubulin complex component 5 [Ceratobasidium sp. AG-Ba]